MRWGRGSLRRPLGLRMRRLACWGRCIGYCRSRSHRRRCSCCRTGLARRPGGMSSRVETGHCTRRSLGIDHKSYRRLAADTGSGPGVGPGLDNPDADGTAGAAAAGIVDSGHSLLGPGLDCIHTRADRRIHGSAGRSRTVAIAAVGCCRSLLDYGLRHRCHIRTHSGSGSALPGRRRRRPSSLEPTLLWMEASSAGLQFDSTDKHKTSGLSLIAWCSVRFRKRIEC